MTSNSRKENFKEIKIKITNKIDSHTRSNLSTIALILLCQTQVWTAVGQKNTSI